MSMTAIPEKRTGVVQSSMKWVGAAGRVDWFGGGAAVYLLLMLILAVFGPALAPQDPAAQDLSSRLVPPGLSNDSGHLLGTDKLGRDILSRLIVGARLDLGIGVAAAFFAATLGVVLGVLAGYKEGRADAVIMRWCDIQMGFPPGLFVMFMILLFGGDPLTMIIALGLHSWMMTARLIRSDVRGVSGEPFVHAAIVSGASTRTVLRRHVLPNIRGRATVGFLLEVPQLILAVATLNFLGLGVDPSHVSWGVEIGSSRDLLAVAWWPTVLPGLMIVSTVASLYVFASWIEPRLDPLRR